MFRKELTYGFPQISLKPKKKKSPRRCPLAIADTRIWDLKFSGFTATCGEKTLQRRGSGAGLLLPQLSWFSAALQ